MICSINEQGLESFSGILSKEPESPACWQNKQEQCCKPHGGQRGRTQRRDKHEWEPANKVAKKETKKSDNDEHYLAPSSWSRISLTVIQTEITTLNQIGGMLGKK